MIEAVTRSTAGPVSGRLSTNWKGLLPTMDTTDKTRADEIREQCNRFHQEHPEVWELFKRFTNQAISSGFKHYSAMAVMQRVRWEADVGGDGATIFKVNNNYVPFYARRFMVMFPEHDGFFRTRHQTSEDAPATDLPELTPRDYE